MNETGLVLVDFLIMITKIVIVVGININLVMVFIGLAPGRWTGKTSFDLSRYEYLYALLYTTLGTTTLATVTGPHRPQFFPSCQSVS